MDSVSLISFEKNAFSAFSDKEEFLKKIDRHKKK